MSDDIDTPAPLTVMAIHIHEIYTALVDGGFDPEQALYIVTQMMLHDWGNKHAAD